jgi:hypothetical protein
MEIHFQIIGWILVVLALVHIDFPRRFNWPIELKHLSLINRQMMRVHTLFIALVILLNGLLFIFCAKELTEPGKLGVAINIGLFVFWSLRCILQHIGYSSALWKGKTFETTVHIFFSFFWLYISIVLGLNLWQLV